MNFLKHSDLEGKHAFLGASKYAWLRYDDEQLVRAYSNARAKERGTELHEFAATCIRLNQKLPKSTKTLNMFVNDAIGFRMSPEVLLYYSDVAFGTADAISFNKNILRIHDLKTGIVKASMDQLIIYAALFCLEYRYKPNEIEKIELRIYQNDDVVVCAPEPNVVQAVMDKLRHSSEIVMKLKSEEV